MARRKAKRRTRGKQNLNLLNLAEAAVIGNSMTMGLFGTNLRTFFTDGWFGARGSRFSDFDNSWEVTLGEIFTHPEGAGGRDVATYPWSKVLQTNLKANGAMMVGTLVFAPVIKKAIRKAGAPAFRPINRLLKGTGVKV